MGLNDPALVHVDQVVAQHIRRQQHLTGTALKRFGADGVSVQPNPAWLEAVDQPFAYEHILRTNTNLQACDRRVSAFRELDDEVFDAADLRPGRVQHRAFQKLCEHEPPIVSAALRRGRAYVLTTITQRTSPPPPSALQPAHSPASLEA